jgi:low affinity Fe/Cu permease
MPTLKQSIAEKKAQETALRRNPEIDAKLDQFIQENSKLYEFYQTLSKDDLIRKLMFAKMQRREYAEERNQEIRAWVEEHPEIKTKVEERIRKVSAAKRERMFLNAAKTEAVSQTVRGNSNNIRP